MNGSILITGTSRGIGLSLVEEYSSSGWRVHACVRDTEQAAALMAAASTAPDILVHKLDVTLPEQIENLGRDFATQELDVVINNAAIDDYNGRGLSDLDAVAWQRVFRTNVIGAALVTRAMLPALAKAGRPIVVNMGSRQGSIESNSSGGRYAYRTSKAALNMLTRTLALDLKERGVICVSIHPGWVRTELGGANAPMSARASARAIRDLVSTLSIDSTGTFLDYSGESIPW